MKATNDARYAQNASWFGARAHAVHSAAIRDQCSMSTSLPDIGAPPKPMFPHETFRSLVQLLFPHGPIPTQALFVTFYPLARAGIQKSPAPRAAQEWLCHFFIRSLPPESRMRCRFAGISPR